MCTSRPSLVAVGRERDTFGCAGVLPSPSTLSRSATIIFVFWAELQVDNGVDHVHYILKLSFYFYLSAVYGFVITKPITAYIKQ